MLHSDAGHSGEGGLPFAAVDARKSAGNDALACPKYASAMVRRTAKSGSNAGNEFGGCAKYPACRGIRN
jgi:restriction system protein